MTEAISQNKIGKTTITILQTTRDRLKPIMQANSARRRKKENFDDVINRLVDFHQQNNTIKK